MGGRIPERVEDLKGNSSIKSELVDCFSRIAELRLLIIRCIVNRRQRQMNHRAYGDLIESCLWTFKDEIQVAEGTVVHEILCHIFRIAVDRNPIEGFDDIARCN